MNFDLGTAVEDFGGGKYRIEWDTPTPYQARVRVTIPSKWFCWADDACQPLASRPDDQSTVAREALKQTQG
jgi:hypothetical protein